MSDSIIGYMMPEGRGEGLADRAAIATGGGLLKAKRVKSGRKTTAAKERSR